MKYFFKLIYSTLIGGIALLCINFFTGFFGYHIPLNFVTSIIVGLLGVPGILLLIVLKSLFKA